MLVLCLMEAGPTSIRMHRAKVACSRAGLGESSRHVRRQHRHCGLTGSWSSQVQERPRVEHRLAQVLQAQAVLSSRE